jgi:hypothetical protein
VADLAAATFRCRGNTDARFSAPTARSCSVMSCARDGRFLRMASPPRVRIPIRPPLALAKAFSRFGRSRIFPLYSRVMRDGLSTGVGARRPGSGLSGSIFSGPHDCAASVQTTMSLFL